MYNFSILTDFSPFSRYFERITSVSSPVRHPPLPLPLRSVTALTPFRHRPVPLRTAPLRSVTLNYNFTSNYNFTLNHNSTSNYNFTLDYNCTLNTTSP